MQIIMNPTTTNNVNIFFFGQIFHFFTCAPLLANSDQQTVARRIGNIEAQVCKPVTE